MSFSYIFRLVTLCLASFFIVQAALSLIARTIAPAAIRFSARMRPRAAARFLLLLRLFPGGVGLLAVVALCLPSYLWLEPQAGAEKVGLACSLAALLGAALWASSVIRVARAATVSSRCARDWQRIGKPFRLPEEVPDILVVDDDAPLLALAGVFRPRLVTSRGVLRRLSPDQLNAALRHETAHHASRDNFKRLLLLLAPDALPCVRGFASLERAWSRFSEWAADDRAVEGDAQRSLSLAEALVSVSRMGASPRPSPFLSTLVPDDGDLSARINRLLQPERGPEKSRRRMQLLAAGASVAVAGLLLAALLQPATFYAVHRLLEHLVR
ncbi:MAG TPA: M56 family metallopeptidase [Candidatus Acidoferrales bacterium]|nr:M56 family metallopeptidase [Candidatus Acidoferrales bacterium]HEV2340472.1 M56 family metallopeptidase [Candidatus Acidoferrales bacterium]